MLSEKPWRPDLVLRFFAGLFASMCLGILIVSGYDALASEAGKKNRDLYLFIIGVFSFHGVGLVLVDVVLRQHQLSWSEAFGFNQPRLSRAIFLGLLVGVISLPIAWSLTELSSKILRLLQLPIEPQSAVRIIQGASSKTHLIYHGIAAVLIAPFVEELVFRGILYPFVKQRGHHKLALWGTSILFGLTHGNLMILLPLTLLAIMLTLLYETTNNLLAPIVTHTFFNAANFGYLLYQMHQQGAL